MKKFRLFKRVNMIRFFCTIKFLLCLFLIILLFGCASGRRYIAPNLLPDDTRDIPEPRFEKITYAHDAYNKIITLQAKQSFEFSRQLRHVLGKPKQAFNVDVFGEVSNSSWFTSRNGHRQMSLDEISRGPDTGIGPDTSSPWTIIQAKAEGVTPGFHMSDSRGDKYLIKFDPIGYSELATGAEVVCTKIFYAVGYSVPENSIAYFDPKILQIGENVEFADEHGDKRLMTEKDIETILKKVEHLPDGRIRCIASKYIEGKPLGGFQYEGTRKDDPNDIVPHEHRRELRGLYVLSAWLKHFDTKAGNNYDAYVYKNGRHFVKHYLIDFGATLGSSTYSPQPPYKGHEYDVDIRALIGNLIVFGLYVHPWEKLGDILYPSIGRFDSHDFDPGNSRTNYPNPAFENCTNLDGHWGAKLVMSFTDEQLEAIVKTGQYSNPEAEAYLLKILKERRDKTGYYWYSIVNPLDKFKISESASGNLHLNFEDMGVEGNLWSSEQSRYRYDFHINNIKVLESVDGGNSTSIPLTRLEKIARKNNKIKRKLAADDHWEITLWVQRESRGNWSKWVKVYLAMDSLSRQFTLLEIRRQN